MKLETLNRSFKFDRPTSPVAKRRSLIEGE
jgi:hypothetical protein